MASRTKAVGMRVSVWVDMVELLKGSDTGSGRVVEDGELEMRMTDRCDSLWLVCCSVACWLILRWLSRYREKNANAAVWKHHHDQYYSQIEGHARNHDVSHSTALIRLHLAVQGCKDGTSRFFSSLTWFCTREDCSWSWWPCNRYAHLEFLSRAEQCDLTKDGHLGQSVHAVQPSDIADRRCICRMYLAVLASTLNLLHNSWEV